MIATKYTAATRPGDPNSWGNHRKSLRDALDASLRRLRTDYVDVLWLHAWDELTPFEEIMRALDDAVRAGKVLYIGASNTPALGRRARQRPRARRAGGPRSARSSASTTSPSARSRTSSRRWRATSASGCSPTRRSARACSWAGGAAARRRSASPPARAGARKLAANAGLSPATLALAWLRHREQPVIPVAGARTAAHLDGALRSLDVTLEPELLAALDAIAPPAPVLPQAFLHSADGIGFFDQGLREAVVTRS